MKPIHWIAPKASCSRHTGQGHPLDCFPEKATFRTLFIAMIRPRNIDVRALRKCMGMTQEQFCRRFGFELPTLRHWERGDRKPRGPALGAVVKALLNTAFRERNAPSLPPSMKRGPSGRPRGSWRVPV